MPPKITPETLELAGEQIRAYYRELSHRLQQRGLKPLPDVRMYVSRKIQRNYGYAAFRRKGDELVVEKIAIAWAAYRKGPSMWRDVVAHEAAHAYCMVHHSRADHSPAWRHVAQLLGCTGDLVGCEDAGRRQNAQMIADHRPNVLADMSRRDEAAVRLSFRAQKQRTKDDHRAVDATVRRFPQFDERKVRTYLLRVAGLTIPRASQISLPF